MDRAAAQRRIDQIRWYHDFDFADGLQARAESGYSAGHRRLWAFVRRQLDRVDFRGKSVLDVGCWDGYWSFEAERRGAASVLATDDATQNWAGAAGLHLAKELLGSGVETDTRRSVYELTGLGRTFDVILFFGVYYHLHAPLPALAQLRHCCHPGTVVLVVGPVTQGLPEGAALYDYPNHAAEWLPTAGALTQLAEAAYFRVDGREQMDPPDGGRVGWRYRLGLCRAALAGSRRGIRERAERLAPPRHAVARVFLTLSPRDGEVPLHAYPPPFGLAAYDPRFRRAA